MKLLVLGLCLCAGVSAQSLSFYLGSSDGPTSTTLPSPYSFPDTPVGSPSKIVVWVKNTGTSSVTLNAIYIGAAANSGLATNNFSVTGQQTSSILAPGASWPFTVSFTPSTTGISYGYLQASIGDAPQVSTLAIATLQGTGLPPQLTLACRSTLASQCDGSVLQPNSASILDFGTSSTTATLNIPFTLTNNTGSAVNPQTLLSIATTTNNPNTPFSFSSLPSSLANGASLDFDLIFAPGAALTYRTNLLLGSVQYPIQATGTGSVLGDISSLVITYTDTTGVRLTAQPNSAINFGSLVAAAGTSATLTFTVSNPQTTIQPVPVSAVAVSGTSFTLASAPPLPASIAPGSSIAFKVTFTPSSIASYSGTVAIGTRIFNLTGTGTASVVPAPSFQVDPSPLSNAQQAHLTINLANPSQVTMTGVLTLSFTPSVSLAQDDPAIQFVATGTRQLNVTISKGAQTATYNGQAAITFQTGTTAGTLKLTLEFEGQLTYSQTYMLTPAPIVITSSSAISQPPYLVVTLTGYDNTYSAGPIVFTFYDSAGKALLSKPLSVDATNDFHNYFASSTNQTGGAFSLQAKFPVTGDITKIANLGIVMTNSAGSTNVSQK